MFFFRKKMMEEFGQRRLMPAQTDGFFTTVLVLVCAFMAVIMFGSGSVIGGALFSLVVFIGVYAAYDTMRARFYPTPEDDEPSALEP